MGFRFCKAPVEIRDDGLICRDTVKQPDGSFVQVEGSETFYPHTGVIISVLLTVDHDGRTTRPGVFAGGDAVKGARTVVEAVAMAKDVAVAMDEYMKALPPDEAADPYANIPVFETPTSDVFGEQELKV